MSGYTFALTRLVAGTGMFVLASLGCLNLQAAHFESHVALGRSADAPLSVQSVVQADTTSQADALAYARPRKKLRATGRLRTMTDNSNSAESKFEYPLYELPAQTPVQPTDAPPAETPQPDLQTEVSIHPTQQPAATTEEPAAQAVKPAPPAEEPALQMEQAAEAVNEPAAAEEPTPQTEEPAGLVDESAAAEMPADVTDRNLDAANSQIQAPQQSAAAAGPIQNFSLAFAEEGVAHIKSPAAPAAEAASMPMMTNGYGYCPECGNGYGCRQPGRFGYFHHDGCCGEGCGIWGHYGLVYATNPEYFDPRDGRIFSAEGWNVPVAIPLAPNVRHQYNYGWGIPSSRLTPISRQIPETQWIPQPASSP